MTVSRRYLATVVVSLAGLTSLAAPAQAQDFGIEEFRAGVFYHDAYRGFVPTDTGNFNFSNLEDVSFSALFTSPDVAAFEWIGSPRPELGATVSLAGKENLVHANLNWQFGLGESPFYLELGLGAALTDASLSGAPKPARNMGCALNFYESAGVGAHVSETVTATLRYEHMSNLGLCTPNQGLSNLGLMIGFKF